MDTDSFLSVTSTESNGNRQAFDDADWLHISVERLLYVTRAVASAESFPGLLQAVAEACVGIGGAESAGIYLLDDDLQFFTVGWEATVPDWPAVRPAGVRLVFGQWHGMVLALERARPLSWIRDDSLLSEFERDHYVREDVGSGVDVPLICGGQKLGFLKLFRRSTAPWQDRDVELTSMIGATVSLALASEQLLARANLQSRDQASLARIAQVAITQHEPKDLLQRVADEIRTLLPYRGVDIELWFPSSDRCEIVAHSVDPDWPMPTDDVVFYRLSDWPANIRMLRELDIVTIDVADGLLENEHEYLVERGLSQLHYVPLLYGDACLGAIILHDAERIPIEDRSRVLIAEAAAITALAARAARSLRDTQWERRAQTWQLRVNNAVLNDAALTDIVDEALASLLDMTGAAACVATIEDPGGAGQVEQRFAVSGDLLLYRLKQFQSQIWPVVAEARSRGRHVFARIDDHSVGALDAEALTRHGQEWVLATPMMHDGRRIGSLVLCFPEDFLASEEILHFVRTMARQIAVVASDRLMRDEQEQSALHTAIMLKVIQAAVAGNDLETLLRVIATACLELGEIDGCEIELYDPEQRALTNFLLVFGGEWTFPYQKGVVQSLEDWPFYRDVINFRISQAFRVDEPSLTQVESAGLKAIGVRNVLAAPLSIGNDVLGVMTLYRVADHPFSARTVEFAGELAAQASLALERARLFAALQSRADTDGVTGLLNHRAILERIDAAIAAALRAQTPVSLLLIDLDHFKLLNDVNGHLTGDRYLRSMGALVEEIVSNRGTVGRYGGDEFLVLLPRTDASECVALAVSLLERGRESTFEVQRMPVPYRFSIGAATAPLHGRTRDELIHAADRAMYDAKKQGGGRVGLPPESEEIGR